MTVDPRRITVGPGPRCVWLWKTPEYSSAFDHFSELEAWQAMERVMGTREGGKVWQTHGTWCTCDTA